MKRLDYNAQINKIRYQIWRGRDGKIYAISKDGKYDLGLTEIESLQILQQALLKVVKSKQKDCLHPNSHYVCDEEGISCTKRKYVRERWECPDCGASWVDAVRWWDDKLKRYC